MRALVFSCLLLFGCLSVAAAEAPKRIAALAPNVVEMLFAVGAGNQIIATVEHSDYPQQAQSIPRIGRHDRIDLEALLALEPDLIVVSKVDTNALLLGQLELVGVPIIDASVESLAEVPVRLRQLGQLTGNVAQADKVAFDFAQRLDSQTTAYADATKLRVFYQVWPEPLTTVSSGWLNEMIERCGGQNIFAGATSAYPQVSVEQILAANPQVIFKPVAASFDNQESQPWSDWREIDAVKQGSVFTLNSDLMHRSGPRAIDGLGQLCGAMDMARTNNRRHLD